jgi:hypothetical protein
MVRDLDEEDESLARPRVVAFPARIGDPTKADNRIWASGSLRRHEVFSPPST